MLQNLRECIRELLECDAFELQVHTDVSGRIDYYLPYMMNDALECYFILKDCQMTGEYSGHLSEDAKDSASFGNFASDKKMEVELIETPSSPALIIRQINGNIATVWFKDITKELKCYRYHEIGHFWVKGQEQWRQLVYIIGTIYDKFEYMGTSICNDEEMALLPLMEFAPFRYWSPIHESLDGHYPDTADGIDCFRKLCEESRDHLLLKLVNQYEKSFSILEKLANRSSFSFDMYEKYVFSPAMNKLAVELSKSGHEALYELLYKKVCEASSKYPERDYGSSVNEKITLSRTHASSALASKGFVGEYPRFSKGNLSILVTEEHPFTLSALEYDNYEFRLQMMVSETVDKACFINQGFFEGHGNHGWIAKSTDELE